MFVVNTELRTMTVKNADILVSENVRTYPITFMFSADWDGYKKVAVFQSVGGDPVEMVLPTSKTLIPWEVLSVPGREVAVGVYGVNDNGDILSSMPVVLGEVNQGTEVENQEWMEFTPDLLDQLLQWIENSGGIAATYEFGHGLKVDGRVVTVNTVDNFEGDNTLPITAAGVLASVGNIAALLETI